MFSAGSESFRGFLSIFIAFLRMWNHLVLSCSGVLRDVPASFWALGPAVVIMIPASSCWRLALELSCPRVLLVVLTSLFGNVRPWVIVSIRRWSRCAIGRWCCSQGFVATHSWSVLLPERDEGSFWGHLTSIGKHSSFP